MRSAAYLRHRKPEFISILFAVCVSCSNIDLAQAQMVLIPLPSSQLPPLPVCPKISDKQFADAIAKAAATREKFFTSYKNSNFITRGEYQVFVAFDAKVTAGAWVRVTGLIRDTFSSTIVELSDEKKISGLKIGQEVTGRVTDPLDWLYKKGGKTYGDFVARATVSNCSEADQKQWFDRIYDRNSVPVSW